MEIPDEVLERAEHFQESRMDAEAAQVIVEWARKTIADQVRRNCTLDWETVKKGGDHIVYGVADWIENPPEWVGAAA